MRTQMFVIAAIAALTFAACGGKHGGTSPSNTGGGGSGSATATKSLYDRLGGKDAIVAVVEDFVANVAQDPRINTFFTNADVPAFKQKLVDQICEATGGPCHYSGKDMKTAHAGMAIKDADFNALVEDLKKSLDKIKVGPREQSDLLAALAKMHDDIVTAK